MSINHTNAIFISDLHLTENRPDCIRAFYSFLEWIPAETEALFILGDFFEYWIGDDIATELSKAVAEKLATQSKSKNINLYFLPGNRDFSLGNRYCQLSNMELIGDNTTVCIGGERLLLSHGDLLCTDDISYQRFRAVIRHPVVMNILLSLPARFRRRLAEKFRQNSAEKFKRYESLIDVNQDAVLDSATSHASNILIHGHTHLADIHLHQSSRGNIQRMVLGDWHNLGWFGRFDGKQLSLHQFDIAAPDFQAALGTPL